MAETTAAPPVRQRKKPARFCRLTRDEHGCRTLHLRIAKKADAYDLLEIEASEGRGYELTKADGTVYHVNVNGPLCSLCDCKGFARHSHCKHVDALTALEAAGRL